MRAIALFTPDPTLTWSESTAPMTVAVSGATNVTRPSPKRIAPGSTSFVQSVSDPMRDRSSSPAAVRSGPTVSCSRGPMRWASEPDAAEKRNMSTVAGSSAIPARERRPAGRHLQLVGHEEERHADRGVEEHGREVRHREFAPLEQRGRHEWVVVVHHSVHERADAEQRDHAGDDHAGVGPAVRTRLRERVCAGAERDHRQARADEVEATRRVRIARLRYRDACAHDDDQRDRHVDEERPTPTRSVDEPAAEERTDRARDTAEARPRADGGARSG